ncbi:hypothetical protein ACFX1X_035608 [Malus domestica]
MNDALRKHVKEMEIRKALAQMGGLKASDPDGFRGVPHPEFVNQFRLISLCNYSYKDNIILAHEVFHFLKLRKAKHRFELGIKLDMNKTYDRVE